MSAVNPEKKSDNVKEFHSHLNNVLFDVFFFFFYFTDNL